MRFLLLFLCLFITFKAHASVLYVVEGLNIVRFDTHSEGYPQRIQNVFEQGDKVFQIVASPYYLFIAYENGQGLDGVKIFNKDEQDFAAAFEFHKNEKCQCIGYDPFSKSFMIVTRENYQSHLYFYNEQLADVRKETLHVRSYINYQGAQVNQAYASIPFSITSGYEAFDYDMIDCKGLCQTVSIGSDGLSISLHPKISFEGRILKACCGSYAKAFQIDTSLDSKVFNVQEALKRRFLKQGQNPSAIHVYVEGEMPAAYLIGEHIHAFALKGQFMAAVYGKGDQKTLSLFDLETQSVPFSNAYALGDVKALCFDQK